MNKLANGLGKKAFREAVIGASEEVIAGLCDYFGQKGLKVVLLEDDDNLKEECDIVLYRIGWVEESVYFSPFKANGYFPNLVISVSCLPTERVLEQLCGFLEAIKF